MGSLSIWHWLIIAVVFVMFFGAKRMPDAARSLGRSLRIFKSEVSQMQNEGGNTGSASSTAPAAPLSSCRPARPRTRRPPISRAPSRKRSDPRVDRSEFELAPAIVLLASGHRSRRR